MAKIPFQQIISGRNESRLYMLFQGGKEGRVQFIRGRGGGGGGVGMMHKVFVCAVIQFICLILMYM